MENVHIKVFSLFSGYGGFELGIIQAIGDRAEFVGYSEIDSYAIKVYQKHFKHKNYGDVSKINWSEVPDFNLLTGGSPCQDFSIAGKRKGIRGERSGLVWEFIRCLEEKKPRYFIWENVKGVMSSRRGFDFANILTAFSEVGYSLEWAVLNAKHFGVPQNRERVFIIGHLGGFGGRQVFPIGSECPENKSKVATTLMARDYKGIGNQQMNLVKQYGKLDDRTLESEKGLPRTEGDLLNMQQGEENGDTPHRQGLAQQRPEKLTGSMSELPQQDTPAKKEMSDMWTPSEGTPSLQQALYSMEKGETRIRRLTPTESERLMGLPDGWTEGVSDTQRYKLCGNGVVVPVVKEIIKRLCVQQ